MRNSFSFDLKILKETDILIKVVIPFQSLAPKYFVMKVNLRLFTPSAGIIKEVEKTQSSPKSLVMKLQRLTFTMSDRTPSV